MPFPHKTVLITGATAGIGRALAERLIENNVFVIAVGRRKERLDGLVSKYGANKVAAEEFDVTDLDAIPAWAEKITKAYPALSSIILNAGIQRTLDFTSPNIPETTSKVLSEVTTNYTSPLLTMTALLPHLISLNPEPASVIIVTSGLALVPIARCANYCATKAALHSLGMTLRSQLAAPDAVERTGHVRVVDIIPPAVQTELHELQPELVATGQASFGMPLKEFLDETWASLDRWDPDENEIMVSQVRHQFGHVEDERKKVFKGLEGMMRDMAKQKPGPKA